MPQNLSKKLIPGKKLPVPRPLIYNLATRRDQTQVDKLLKDKPHIIDTYEQQLKELFILQNPALYMEPDQLKKEFTSYKTQIFANQEPWQSGRWIYLSWRRTLIHILGDNDYQIVRTGRNRNLITPEEQEKFYNSTIGIAGLSVGNSVALTIALTGGGKHMKLADPDTLELTNMNRIRTSITEITEPKVYLTARQIYELDPYAKLELFTDGITNKNIDKFCQNTDLLIDEIDNLPMKIELRKQAKKYKVPLITAVDNGDSGIIDVERHDESSQIEYFHGRAGKDIAEKVKKPMPLPIVGKIIGEKLVGYDNIEPRMQASLLDIGKSIPTWPQLGNAAQLNGVALSIVARKILTGQPVTNKRAIISLPDQLIPGYTSLSQIKKRKQATKKFAQQYEIQTDQLISTT